jgi:pimeloyl-ACP methyl ester carboxylesterase
MTRRKFAMMLCALSIAAGLSGAPAVSGSRGDITGVIDIGGGRKLFTECRGIGYPTVVLMAGKGNGAQDWFEVLDPNDPEREAPGDDVSLGLGHLIRSGAAVLPSVARVTRVCTYDRPDVRTEGDDISTPRSQPHTVDLDVDDLHRFLAALGDPGPYVLVAHSYAGAIATLNARTYPETVAGLVMVDAVSEHIAEAMNPAKLANWDASNAATSPQAREGVQIVDAFDQIRAAPPMSTVPAVVLSADKPWRTDLLPPEAGQGEQVDFADCLAGQQRLAAALDVEPVSHTDSGHGIYLYRPQLVVDAITAVVDQIRAREGSRS